MPPALPLKIAIATYGHTAAFKNGSIAAEGIRTDFIEVTPIIAAFRRILNVPARGIGKTTEARLLEAAFEAGVGPRELLRDREALAAFGRARNALTRCADGGV